MKIAVIGLGLIGGSFCKAITAKTQHSCYGLDLDQASISSAVSDGAIVGGIGCDELSEMDMTIVCLHPHAALDFIKANAVNFKKGSIVIDSCGVKTNIVSEAEKALIPFGVSFVGCHPMAGREFSGYAYSQASLFERASFIITPTETTNELDVSAVSEFAKAVGFARVVITTPHEHDRIIAFTSQLAHVVSSAYVKSPTLQSFNGFSAGSFMDLTRVAKLNEDMWTSLFLMNKGPLINEIETITEKLNEYKEALRSDNSEELKKLLKEGRILKESIETQQTLSNLK